MNINEEKIVTIIKQQKICSFTKLAKLLNLPIRENLNLTKKLRSMVENHVIFTTAEYDYYVPHYLGVTTGILSLNSKGFGFVELDSKNSIFILNKNINQALNGDEVEVKYFRDVKYHDKFHGIISKVIKRNKLMFVGTIISTKFGLTVKPLDSRINHSIKLSSKVPLQVNDQVKVKILQVTNQYIECEVLKVLGKSDDVAIDILSAIEDANIVYEFSHETLLEARKLPQQVQPKELINRQDLREDLIFTIDGDDTKDFDDAIEVHKLANGNYLLGVHIADVTHYVKENSPLDVEAKSRGTSVYLVDRVIPMLPKELSNNICSLNPNVDRLVLSVKIEINSLGETVKYQIFPAVINSKYRLTYGEVNQFYKNNHDFSDSKLKQMLIDALELSKIIRKFKEKEGYIDFEITESKIIVDELGKPIEIVARERGDSEMLIEDFMVRANETVAFHVAEAKLPFIYRVHDKPDLEKLTSLENVVRILGLEIKIPRQAIPKEFALAIHQIKQFRFDDFIKVMMLRTMAKAIYSPNNIGHFGLASKFYTHFTSPIRRYPDLMVHRMLYAYFINKQKNSAQHFKSILEDISNISSIAEQKSMELERKVDDIKKAQYYGELIGQSFVGQITTINKYGFFVEFSNKAGGLVHSSTMLDNKYQVTSNGLVFESKNRKLTIGDEVSVTVINVNKTEGKIDLILSEFYEKWQKTSFLSNLSR